MRTLLAGDFAAAVALLEDNADFEDVDRATVPYQQAMADLSPAGAARARQLLGESAAKLSAIAPNEGPEIQTFPIREAGESLRGNSAI